MKRTLMGQFYPTGNVCKLKTKTGHVRGIVMANGAETKKDYQRRLRLVLPQYQGRTI